MVISTMLKEIRENAGLSQEQFAERLVVSRQAVSKWERGAAMPDIENLMYISDLFNVSLDTIVKGDEQMAKKIISDNKNVNLVGRLSIIIPVTAAAVIAFIFGFRGIVLLTFDPKAIIIMVIFPLLFQFLLYGKCLPAAFSVISKKEKEETVWKSAEDFFNNYMVVLWMTAILIITIDFILGLKWLESRDGLGPMLFFMANIIITAGLINLVIVTPYKVKIKSHFIQMENK